jgi:hypothetical protein
MTKSTVTDFTPFFHTITLQCLHILPSVIQYRVYIYTQSRTIKRYKSKTDLIIYFPYTCFIYLLCTNNIGCKWPSYLECHRKFYFTIVQWNITNILLQYVYNPYCSWSSGQWLTWWPCVRSRGFTGRRSTWRPHRAPTYCSPVWRMPPAISGSRTVTQ